MRWSAFVAVLASLGVPGLGMAEEAVTLKNRTGTHRLVVTDGAVYHALDAGPLGSVNDETARAPGGNRLAGVVAVAGSGFADLDDIHVVAVDKDGGVWHTARLPDGRWLRWGSVGAEVRLTAKAVGVRCSSTGRVLTVVLRDADGREQTVTRAADGTWAK